MTKGCLKGNRSRENPAVRDGWCSDARKVSKKWSGYALSLAVCAALHPATVQAAAEAWPETTSAHPVSTPVEPIGPIAPAEMDSAILSGRTFSSGNPLPPGEGPLAEDTTDVDIGSGTDQTSFWKPEIHAGVTTGVVLDDNIFITNENPVSDTTFVVSARATLAFGNVQAWASRFIDTTDRALLADEEQGADNLIALTYAPKANFFADNDDLDSVDHDLAGTTRWNLGKLKFAFDGRFQTLSNPDEELGQRSERKITTFNFQSTYEWSDKTRLQLTSAFRNRDYDVGRDSAQIEADGIFLYSVAPKTIVGFGLGGGQLDQDEAESQTFERAVLRVSYNSYSKLSFNFSAGAELRQKPGGEDDSNGIFQASVIYLPTFNSEIILSAYRQVEPSAEQISENIARTSYVLSYNQVLLQALTLSTSLEYSSLEFSTTSVSVDQGRSDDFLRLSIGLTFEVTRNGYVRLAYNYRQNDSTLTMREYDANQFIFSATALF